MGMVAYFTAVSPAKLDELGADPDLVEPFLFPNDGDDEPDNTVDIDKAWHGIDFLLRQIAEEQDAPLAAAVAGGTDLGEDLGYGPPRALSAQEVQAIAAALALVTPDQLKQAYDPEAMGAACIYPDIWERDGAEALDYLLHYFPAVVAFYQAAAGRGDGALLWLA
jgi:hypothetical protein